MCAQFQLRTNAKKVAEALDAKIVESDIHWNPRILPYAHAPVLISDGRERLLKLMQFSLIPSWSQESKVKFATHNARLYSFDEKKKKTIPIYEKPTWRTPFSAKHCLIPMDSFIEPIYRGEFAGNMVMFSEKSGGFMVAAGLWDEWISKKGDQVIDSFTILTHDPISFVKKIGHERSPVFLPSGAFDEWLTPNKDKPEKILKFLLDHATEPKLGFEKDRPLKPGWEKRI